MRASICCVGVLMDGTGSAAESAASSESNSKVEPSPFNSVVEGTCFAAGTLVRTKEGMRPIEEIQVGDWVLSHPEDEPLPPKWKLLEEQNAYRQVAKTFVHEDKKISRVTYLNLASGNQETLLVTPNHPIWVKYVGWTAVADLQVGHTLVMNNGGNNIVVKVEHTEETARVFNIEVEEFHTYFAGNMQVWVHNKNPPTFATGLKGSSSNIWGSCDVGK